MATITVHKCDTCGRLWKDGKNDKAIEIEINVSSQDDKYAATKTKKALFCGRQCAELWTAALILSYKPKIRKEGDSRPGQYRIVLPNPFGLPWETPQPPSEDDDEEE